MAYQKTFCLGRFSSFDTDNNNNIILNYHKNGNSFVQRCFLSRGCTHPSDLVPDDLILIERNEQYYVKKRNGDGRYSMPLVMNIYKVANCDPLNIIYSCFNEELQSKESD